MVKEKPVILKENRILLDSIELSTFTDAETTQVIPSPDGLKVLLKVDSLIKIVYLHDMQKLKERTRTLPLE